MMLVKVSSKQLCIVPRLSLGVHLEFQAKKKNAKSDFHLHDYCGQINSQ